MMLIDSGMTLSRSMVASDVGVTTPLRSITVTPSMPSALSWLSTLTAPPSTMTMWYGMSSAVRPGENRGRSFSSGPSIASSSDIDLAISRTGPAASVSSGCIACGSHFIQSHDGIRSGDAHSEIRRSSGEWNDAAWAIRACTRPRTARGSPAGMMRENDERETAIGRVGTVWGAGGARAPNPPAPPRRHRLQVLDRLGIRRDELDREPLRAAADADVAEVGVAGPALPQPGAHHQRPQRRGVGAVPFQRLTLLRGGAAHLLAYLRQIAE